MAWSFITHVTDYMSRPRLGEQKAPTQWPSEASAVIKNDYGEELIVGKCRRAAYFRLLLDSYDFYKDKYSFYKPLVEQLKIEYIEADPYLKWIWKSGQMYEDICTDMSKASGVYIAEQVAIYIPEYNVSGKIDLVAINPETSKFRTIEVKSVYGYNANSVLGTPAERKRGNLGTPRDSHLMQLAIYDWWYASKNEEFEESLLVYGARDTGRYAEYVVSTESKDDEDYITYAGNSPNVTSSTTTSISMQNIMSQYKMISNCIDSGEIPKRDFDAVYSDEKIDTLYERGELSATDKKQYEKRKDQLTSGKSRVVKKVEKGDWQCRYCNYRNLCYNKDNTPTDL
tara:strand:- start:11994 stop:13016 length:1023 start_codon:yes stop_codon:yes gene_type:complete